LEDKYTLKLEAAMTVVGSDVIGDGQKNGGRRLVLADGSS
jgi:hypothetical protein